MRIDGAIIYLNEPLFGQTVLSGPVMVMTTWLDYTFNKAIPAAEMGLDAHEPPVEQVRVLIPLSNVRAVVTDGTINIQGGKYEIGQSYPESRKFESL
jgi:hypothetical protein